MGVGSSKGFPSTRATAIVLAFLLFTIGLFGPPVQGQLYTDPDGRYSIEFPDGWIPFPTQGASAEVLAALEDVDIGYSDPVADDYKESIFISSFFDMDGKNSEEYILQKTRDQLEFSLARHPDTWSLVQRIETRNLNGHWASSFSVEITYPGYFTVREYLTYVYSEGHATRFLIICTAKVEAFGNYSTMFNESVDTFRVLNEPWMSLQARTMLFVLVSVVGLVFVIGVIVLVKRRKKLRVPPAPPPVPGFGAVPEEPLVKGYRSDEMESDTEQ